MKRIVLATPIKIMSLFGLASGLCFLLTAPPDLKFVGIIVIVFPLIGWKLDEIVDFTFRHL